MKSLIKKIAPTFLRSMYYTLNIKLFLLKSKKFKTHIINYLQNKVDLSEEENEVLQYLLQNKTLSTFPYDFCKKYKRENIHIIYDERNKMNYVVLFGNKRLYFKKKMSKKMSAEYINSMLTEQDKNSPHCYLSDNFYVKNGDIVADVGAAEGFFALSIIDLAKKVYLFEPESEWIEPLKATFEPWKEKVEIIPKYISNINSKNTITLDCFFKDKELPTFIKADIEGFEEKLLIGSENIVNDSSTLSVILCTYHRQNDYENFHDFFVKRNFKVETSHGYMIFIDNNFNYPYLRKGVIKAKK
jgi:hypothetical protein